MAMILEDSLRGSVDYDSSSEAGADVPTSVGPAVARAGKSHVQLRAQLRLPVDEQYVDAYHCALRDKILIQGELAGSSVCSFVGSRPPLDRYVERASRGRSHA